MAQSNDLEAITLRDASEISKILRMQRYAVVRAADFNICDSLSCDWAGFRSSWENLACDPYLPDGGRYRSRRYSRFNFDRQAFVISELPHRSYFQSTEYNHIAGGILRNFEALEKNIYQHKILRAIIMTDARLLSMINNDQAIWHVDVHQIRTIATPEKRGHVVPEGIHQDGLTFIATHLIQRSNVGGGVSGIYNLSKHLIESFVLEESLDTFYAFDDDVMHDASSIKVESNGLSGHRDTLLVGFKPIEEQTPWKFLQT